jgi:hypothetical protein
MIVLGRQTRIERQTDLHIWTCQIKRDALFRRANRDRKRDHATKFPFNFDRRWTIDELFDSIVIEDHLPCRSLSTGKAQPLKITSKLLFIRRKIVNNGSVAILFLFSPETTDLTRGWIPGSITILSGKHLKQCTKLQSLSFESPSGLIRIESEAFSFSSLRSIEIPADHPFSFHFFPVFKRLLPLSGKTEGIRENNFLPSISILGIYSETSSWRSRADMIE